MAWNGSAGIVPHQATPRLSSGVKCVVALVVVVAMVAIICVFIFSNTRNRKKVVVVSERSGAIVEVAPKLPKSVTRERQNDVHVATDDVNLEKQPRDHVVSVETNATGYIMSTIVGKNGKRRLRISEPPSKWQFQTDSIIAGVLTAPDDEEMPPLPPLDETEDARFIESLKYPIEILPTDDEQSKIEKQIVQLAREQIKEMMDSYGESFIEVLKRHRELANDNSHVRYGVNKEYSDLVDAGKYEDAEMYRLAVNKAIEPMGIRAIERRDLEQERLEIENEAANAAAKQTK